MTLAATIASIVLGGAFVLAGGTKLAAGTAWSRQAVDLGAPRWTIPFVPWTELALGAGLVVQLARGWLAATAGLLLTAFTVLILVQLARGRRPRCACFGAWSARPLGPGHVARNGGLLALAALIVVEATIAS